MVGVVGHNDQEDKLRVLYCAIRLLNHGQYFLIVVVLNALSKRLKKNFLVVSSLVGYWTNMSEFNLNAESFLGGKIIELVVDVICVTHISFQTENCEALKHLWLMYHCVKIVRIVQNTRDASISRFVLILLTWVLVSSRSLSGKIWRLENLWSFENFGFNCIRRQGDVKAPLLDLFAR